MSDLKQFRSKMLSLWQSAVDEVVAKKTAEVRTLDVGGPAPAITRPDPDHVMVSAAAALCAAIEHRPAGLATPRADSAVTLGVGESLEFCAVAAFKLAEARVQAVFTGNDTAVKRLEEELGAQFGLCDPKWAQVIQVYVASRIANTPIPYRRHDQDDPFVIDGRLPTQAKVALVADWGTGQDSAQRLLKRIAEQQPDVVIHLGDIYYAGTEHEVQHYFYQLWQDTLNLPPVPWGMKPSGDTHPATFTLAGNHDMYAGGQPYYTLIDMLGQPASYFCLRNRHWQFLALDTGLHDADPRDDTPTAPTATYLEATEVAWLKDQMAHAGGRKTVLLSHHQLFSAYEQIAGDHVNQRLLDQLQDVLPQVTVWFWGHEHNLVIYQPFQHVLARCIGHGAFPVSEGEIAPPDPGIPIEAVRLALDSLGGLFQHGYAIMDLDGVAARVSYFQYDPNTDQERVLYTESL